MKIIAIQPVLPRYDCDFFSLLQKEFSNLDLLVLADIETKSPLNQYNKLVALFNVRHLRNLMVGGFFFRPGLLKTIANERQSFFVFNGNPRDISQLLGMIFLRTLGRPFYVWGMFHRIGGPRLISTLYYKLVGKIATKCLCYSRIGASNLISLGVSPARIGVVGTAIDESIPNAVRISKRPEELDAFRSQLGLLEKHLILQVVRLSSYKRPEYLIEAAEILLGQRSDVVFALIGGGEMQDELINLVKKKGLQESILFLGPIYDEQILANWYLSASAFVVPTCIGLSAHHAMSYGVPVITDNSLHEQASEFDILSPGLNGLLYKEGNPKSLAAQIEKLIDDDDLYRQLSANALATVYQANSLRNKVKNFASLVSGIEPT